MTTRRRRVAVAGTIGAGKTSLVAWLVKRYDLVPFYEPNEQNPYLADFYGDMSRWAFQSQAFFLAHKLELHQRLEACEGSAVIDRTIYEDAEIFAKNLFQQGHMQKRDWEVYLRLYEGIRRALKPPDFKWSWTIASRSRTAACCISRNGRAAKRILRIDSNLQLNEL